MRIINRHSTTQPHVMRSSEMRVAAPMASRTGRVVDTFCVRRAAPSNTLSESRATNRNTQGILKALKANSGLIEKVVVFGLYFWTIYDTLYKVTPYGKWNALLTTSDAGRWIIFAYAVGYIPIYFLILKPVGGMIWDFSKFAAKKIYYLIDPAAAPIAPGSFDRLAAGIEMPPVPSVIDRTHADMYGEGVNQRMTPEESARVEKRDAALRFWAQMQLPYADPTNLVRQANAKRGPKTEGGKE